MAPAALEHEGVCSAAGWAIGGTGPNCTYVGQRAWRWPPQRPGVMIGSCARNVKAQLERHTKAWAEAVLTLVDGGMVIFEDSQRAGDPDGSRVALREWAAADVRVRLILAQPLLYPKWSRTQRLALCRNMLLHEAIAQLPPQGFLASVDIDCDAGEPATVAALLHGTALAAGWPSVPPGPVLAGSAASSVTRPWDVLTFNSPKRYYDRWALRSTLLELDYDCWFNKTAKKRGTCPNMDIAIDRAAPPFEVDSAFNGLGLYRADALQRAAAAGCAYKGTKNSYMCEHVPFHLCLVRLRARMLPGDA